jgi:uncharacterized protein YjbI with pentapeptide repeats
LRSNPLPILRRWYGANVLRTGVSLALLIVFGVFVVLRPEGFSERREALTIAATLIGAMALFMNLVFTSRTVENSRLTLDHQRESQRQTLNLQRKSQQDERFFKAAQLLADKDSIDARIGALFALERLAQESDDYYAQVIEVICSFIRRRSDDVRVNPNVVPSKGVPPAPHDIDVAMMILSRRRMGLGRGEQTGLNLRGAYLSKLTLKGGDFQLADLSQAVLFSTSLTEINLARASLEDAQIQRSTWNDCILIETNLEGSKAFRARFEYGGILDDPYPKVAIASSAVTGRTAITIYEMEAERAAIALVNPGRYLDDSRWFAADLREATFSDSDFFLLADGHESSQMDLSGMRYLSNVQWESFNKPEDCIPPTLWDEEDYNRRYMDEQPKADLEAED